MKHYFILMFICSSAIAEVKNHVDQEINITASRFPQESDRSPGVVDVITREQLQEKSGSNIGQALSEVPGIEVSSSGGTASVSTLFLRGISSDEILVMIDGIVVNDPSASGRGFDFSNINLDEVERIEVLKGPQSGVYGSNAMGGVINVVTKKGTGEASVALIGEWFSLNGGKGGLSVTGGTEGKYWYSTTLSHQQSEGFSTAAKKYGNDEKDGYEQSSITGKFGGVILKDAELELVVKANRNDLELDKFGGEAGDDTNYDSRTDMVAIKVANKVFFDEDQFELNTDVSYSSYERKLENKEDFPGDTSLLSIRYLGSNLAARMSLLIRNGIHTTIIGSEVSEESLEIGGDVTFGAELSPKKAQINSVFAQHSIDHLRYFFTISARGDSHSSAGEFYSYRLSPGVKLSDQSTLKISYGTGVKAPTLYQLHSIYGSTDLKVENSKGGDISFIKKSGDIDKIQITYFINQFDDKIDFSPIENVYRNIGEIEVKGIEVSSSSEMVRSLNLLMSLTFQEAVDRKTKKDLIRRANIFGSLALAFKPNESFRFKPIYRYTGPKQDISSELPAYSVVDISSNYQITSSLSSYINIYNAFDYQYEEISGYGNAGRWGLAGVQWTL